MNAEIKTSLAARIYQLVFREHQKGNYIFTFAEAATSNDQVFAEVSSADLSTIKTIEQYFGEAQIEMLYETSDAAVAGLGLSPNTKHAIFLEHLGRNVGSERCVVKKTLKLSHASKA